MFDNTFTREQIFSGLRIIWREILDHESSLDLDMRFMDEFNDEGSYDEIDFGDVIPYIHRHFGFSCAMEEWKIFLGLHIQSLDEWQRDIAPRLTFRALADFIRERLKPISFEPITLLGKPCLTAGIFRSLERLVEQIHPKATRFAPSTPIRARLRGVRLHRFWSRLRWMLHDQLPPAPRITLTGRGFLHSLYLKCLIGTLIILWKRDPRGLFAGFAATFFLLIPVAWAVELVNVLRNPLPEEIETFGDLARVLAAILLDQQNEAASCSTP
jgi:hypothetical protein